jgi:hypothetical protein
MKPIQKDNGQQSGAQSAWDWTRVAGSTIHGALDGIAMP